MEQLFSITRFTEEKAKHMAAFVFEPHCHDFEELVVCTSGVIENLIDFHRSTIVAPLATFISKGKVHTVNMLPDSAGRYPEGWIFRFKSSLISDSRFQLYSEYHNFANVKLHDKDSFERICTVTNMIEKEHLQSAPDYSIIRSLLSTLFVLIEAERKKQALPAIDNNQTTTFKTFLRILEDNFKRDVSVDFYAEKLNMSARNLNLICRSILQRSVSEIIETRKLTEAKNLLMHTDKTISEIGFELGYNEKAYFTKVFKKKAGVTPSEFRNEMRKTL